MDVEELEERYKAKYLQYVSALRGESERGVVLVAVAFLDDLIKEVLTSTMSEKHKASSSLIRSLFQSNGPIGGFWAKVSIARGFGVIPDWLYSDLQIIRKLRNIFAHEYITADFDDPNVIALTEQLKGADYAVQTFKEPMSEGERLLKSEHLRFRLSAAYNAGVLVGILDRLSKANEKADNN